MKKLIKGIGRSEKGFTLIELLVVVAILGVIAAVVILNIGSFIGSGTEEAANTEAHQVSTAAIAYMTANSLSTLDDTTVEPGQTTGVEAYLLNANGLQATYTLDGTGKITAADKITDSKWGSLVFTTGEWAEPAAT
ncbi:MAG: type II secretion system protein [Dehalococcoidia bacterium]|nr:type II secretion system protein [Dehalococcoidia bacterium]